MLAPALDVVPPLNVMQATILAPVGARKDPAGVVESDAEGVASSLGEDLEAVLRRVVAPDRLAQKVGRLLLFRNLHAYLGRAGATLRPVEPSVRPPAQARRHRVR